MDGRMSALLLIGLTLAASGCITTTEKKVTVRTDNEAPPELPVAKDEPKKPVPPRLLLAFADMKEKEADASKDNPEVQAKLRDEGRRAYQELLKTEPENIEALCGLARMYTRMGDYERAQDTYQKALARHPRDVRLWHGLAMMHNRKKEWAEGIKCFSKALEVDPENQRCLRDLGFTLARTGQIEPSITCLTRAMGSAAAAHYNVALMLLHVGQQDPAGTAPYEARARQLLQQALAANPNLEPARSAWPPGFAQRRRQPCRAWVRRLRELITSANHDPDEPLKTIGGAGSSMRQRLRVP